MSETYGTWLRRMRTVRGLTQEEMGKQIGVARTYVNSIERGRVALPNLEMRLRIFAVLGEDYEPKPSTATSSDFDVITASMLKATEHWTPAYKAVLWRVIDGMNEAMATSGVANPLPEK